MSAIRPMGFSAAGASPLLHAMGQDAGSPVQFKASDDLMRLKQLLHMTSRSSMSFTAPQPCAKFGLVGCEHVVFSDEGDAAGLPTTGASCPGFVPASRAAAFGSVFASLCK